MPRTADSCSQRRVKLCEHWKSDQPHLKWGGSPGEEFALVVKLVQAEQILVRLASRHGCRWRGRALFPTYLRSSLL
jgi:hypothetical protein